jgi:lactate permease
LIGLGFDPIIAVAGTAIGHSWSVTFGDIASSFNALIAATGLRGWDLAPWSGTFLGVACFGCGLAVTHLHGGWRSLRRGGLATLLVGGAMALTQYALAVNGLWNLAGFVAGMAGLIAAVLVTRLPFYRRAQGASSPSPRAGEAGVMPLWLAILPYMVLIVIVVAAELWAPAHELLNRVHLSAPFPEVSTGLGWVTLARTGKRISVFGHAGALLAYASVVAFLIYLAGRRLRIRDLPVILEGTVRSAIPSSIGIAAMVAMAVVMDRCGMTYTLARGLSVVLGEAFALVSPFIGLLGAFMTGSNTNSNVVFAPLQKATAELLGASVLVILGAQTTGGSLGSMIAPAKIIVGCSTAGLEGQEGKVLRKTLPYGLLITAVIGVIAWLAATASSP